MSELANCFWDFLEPLPGGFCEERLCSIVVEPSNTWSNIGYLFVAIAILRSQKITNKRVRHLFFVACFSLFLGSTFFHLSGSYLGKMIDVSAMFFLSMVILTLSVERYFLLRERTANLFFVAGIAASLAFLFTFKFGNVFFAGQILASLYFEIKMPDSQRQLISNQVLRAFAILATAFGFWILDASKILCIPENHLLSGHALWHLLAALAIWTYFLSYKLTSRSQ